MYNHAHSHEAILGVMNVLLGSVPRNTLFTIQLEECLVTTDKVLRSNGTNSMKISGLTHSELFSSNCDVVPPEGNIMFNDNM